MYAHRLQIDYMHNKVYLSMYATMYVCTLYVCMYVCMYVFIMYTCMYSLFHTIRIQLIEIHQHCHNNIQVVTRLQQPGSRINQILKLTLICMCCSSL